jgi:hypothetical protein
VIKLKFTFFGVNQLLANFEDEWSINVLKIAYIIYPTRTK